MRAMSPVQVIGHGQGQKRIAGQTHRKETDLETLSVFLDRSQVIPTKYTQLKSPFSKEIDY